MFRLMLVTSPLAWSPACVSGSPSRFGRKAPKLATPKVSGDGGLTSVITVVVVGGAPPPATVKTVAILLPAGVLGG